MELQEIMICNKLEKTKQRDALSSAYDTMYMELKTTIRQRNELDRELTSVHESFRQRVETEREQYASKARAHCKEPTGIDAILAEREKTHGSFETHANCTQILEDTFYSFKPSLFYNSVMREGLHMIFHKLGRIAAGCATHKDHWDDIAGYATLVSRSLENREKE
jgi:hypothetical protein